MKNDQQVLTEGGIKGKPKGNTQVSGPIKPPPSGKSLSAKVLAMTEEEITKHEWGMVYLTLVEAKNRFNKLGYGNQSWMDAAINLAEERSK